MDAAWLILFLVAIVVAWKYFKRTTKPTPGPSGRLEGPETYEIEVVAESHYQSALERICSGRTAAVIRGGWNRGSL